MTSAEMLTLIRGLANVNSTQFPDDTLLMYLNRVKDDFFSYLITGTRERWGWDTWLTTSVDDQTEYVLPEAASDTAGNLKISGVSINYNGETFPDGRQKYIKATLVDPSNLSDNWNYYVNYQSKNNPIYYVADKSIFIAPSPKDGEGGASRIELKGIKTIPNYDINTTEVNIKFPLFMHKTLVQGVLPYVHRAEGRKNDANFEQQIYEKERNEAVIKFADRNESPIFLSYPDDDKVSDYTINLN